MELESKRGETSPVEETPRQKGRQNEPKEGRQDGDQEIQSVTLYSQVHQGEHRYDEWQAERDDESECQNQMEEEPPSAAEPSVRREEESTHRGRLVGCQGCHQFFLVGCIPE
jgi:hypothetical protein